MGFNARFTERSSSPAQTHPGLPDMNVDRAISELNGWFNRRAVMDLPMLFVLDGPPAVGKSSLATVMASKEDSVERLDVHQLGTNKDLIPAGATTVILDDADQANQVDLIKATGDLLDRGIRVILIALTRRGIAPGLLVMAGTGSVTRQGVRLNRHQSSLRGEEI